MTERVDRGSLPCHDTRREALAVLVALALAALVALPAIVGPGIVNTRGGGDSPFLVQRTHQMAQALRASVFPVRWMPDAALGLGYPTFNYYAALPYYVSAAGTLGGLGVLGGIKLAQILGFLLAGGAAYGLARALGFGRVPSLLASAAYSYAPFHLVNLYVRGDALSEFYAMGLFPLALMQVVLLARKPGLLRVLTLGAAYTALAVTHNISALISSPLLALWLLVMALGTAREARWRVLGLGAAGLLLGLGLSAWFWLPALAEQDLVQLVDQTTGYFHFAGHFRGLDLVQRRLLFDYTLTGSQDPFRMGLLQTLVTCAGLGAMVWGWRRASRNCRLSSALAAAGWMVTTFLMTPLSRPVWETVPLLEYTQFPWRLLAFQGLFGALLIAQIPSVLVRSPEDSAASPLSSAALAAGVAALLIVTSVTGLRVDRLTLEEADVTPYRLMLYEAYSGNLGGTVRYEFLPADMQPRPYSSATLLERGGEPAPLALTGRLQQAVLVASTASSQTWQVAMAEGGWLAFQTAAFPNWAGILDGHEQGVIGVPGLGLLQMEVPAGEHAIALTLGRTRVERWSERLSLLAALLVLAGTVVVLVRDPATRWTGLRVATAILLVGAWLLLSSPREAVTAREGPLVMDYVRSPYLHRLSGGVRVGAATLTDYAFDRESLAPGETLVLTGEWLNVAPASVLRVEFVPLTAHLFPGTPAWAVAETPLSDGITALEIVLPKSLPPGLYALRPTMLVDGAAQAMTTAAGQTLGLLSLAPVQVLDVAPDEPAPTPLAAFGPVDGSPEITLRQADAAQVGERTWQVDMLWQCERQPTRNYQLSVRLMRSDGTQVVARDLPPLAGNYPTSLWQAGHHYPDSLRIALPEDADAGSVTDVEIVLYDGRTLGAIGSVAVPVD
jgi:hypothetical protein